METTYCRQKKISKLLFEGDMNTNYFHAIVNTKRNINDVHKIKNHNGEWCEDKNDIVK